MKKVRVKAGTIVCGGVNHLPGAVLEFDDAEADRIIGLGVAENAVEPELEDDSEGEPDGGETTIETTEGNDSAPSQPDLNPAGQTTTKQALAGQKEGKKR